MRTVVIDHPHNEASALLGIQNGAILRKRGWELGFWIVSDELETPDALAALGQTTSGEWEVVRVETRVRAAKKCEDCETLSRAGSHVYVFGSQFGSKAGPLQPKRHFVARFNESLVDVEHDDRLTLDLDLVRRPFVLHRLINDALREMKIELAPLPDEARERYIAATLQEGRDGDKSWQKLVDEDDVPINVEGSTFADGGLLLLGLRYPVTHDGHPIVVEIEGIDRLFDDSAAQPVVTGVRVIANAGDAKRPSGIRELDARDGWIHAITGDLDEEVMGEGMTASRSEHWMFRQPHGASGVTHVEAEHVRRFARNAQVEGIALAAERVWYAQDDEQIRLAVADLPEPSSAS